MCNISFSAHPATGCIHTLSLHDALPILASERVRTSAIERLTICEKVARGMRGAFSRIRSKTMIDRKSTRLLQSHSDLVCRLLLEKKKKTLHLLTRCCDNTKTGTWHRVSG